MRLWSLHPKHLDRMGLLAQWREGLLAQKVLLGMTTGYRAHPQLNRFRACADPVLAIGQFLDEVVIEAEKRGYRFDGSKIVKKGRCPRLTVQQGQIDYEWEHLLRKLKVRAPEMYESNMKFPRPEQHPLFVVVPGGLEDWERP